MASVNKVILLGYLGADPEVRNTQGGQTVCNFRMATSDSWTDKSSGQRQERTEWHRVQVWGKQAEACGEHLQKGRQVYVEGRISTREYEKDGQKRYVTEIVANQVIFIGSGGSGAGGAGGASGRGSGGSGSGGGSGGGGQRQQSQSDYGSGGQDDIPF